MKSEKKISSLKQDKNLLKQKINDLLQKLEKSEDSKNEYFLQIKKAECRLKQAQVILNDEAGINL